MTIGDRIKTIRGSLSRDKFAPQTSISKTTLVNYETGERNPHSEYLVRLLELYPDISPAWLLTGEGEMKWGEDFPFIGEYRISPELSEIIELLQEEPPETEKLILELLKARKAAREAFEGLAIDNHKVADKTRIEEEKSRKEGEEKSPEGED